MSNFKNAWELAQKIDTMEDWPGDVAIVECVITLRAEVERLKAALKTVGDDYPGSSCQQWCYEQAGIPFPTTGARDE